MPIDQLKINAAEYAVDNFIQSGMLVGLGFGTTAIHAVHRIANLLSEKRLASITAVACSKSTEELAEKLGIPLIDFSLDTRVDITIDGADEVDSQMNLIKGGGGALTREKIIASASKQVVIIADEKKLVETLGSTFKVPIEVLDFAFVTVFKEIEDLGGIPVLREGKGKVGPVVTDNGNNLIDADFGPIQNPGYLNARLHSIQGVMETGLFIGYCKIAYVGTQYGVKTMTTY